jgi:uncharacterized protein (TIGR00269 family)
MRCSSCDKSAIINSPARCKEHFVAEFERRVFDTIGEHRLIKPTDRVAVAVSGGKDSLTVLHLLSQAYDVTAIAVDEGIAGYREKTLGDARRFCVERNIPLRILSFKETYGDTIDELSPERSCSICGVRRRDLLNRGATGFDVLATGHNADDECQAVLMNLLRGHTALFGRIGPSTPGVMGMVRRVKPLYFCTEKEVATYAHLHGFIGEFTECPNADRSYRQLIKESLNEYARAHPGVKRRLLDGFLKAKSLKKTSASGAS